MVTEKQKEAMEAAQVSYDAHHASPMISTIAQLREKNDLHMSVERFVAEDTDVPTGDMSFIRK
jgi:hypothetical protein